MCSKRPLRGYQLPTISPGKRLIHSSVTPLINQSLSEIAKQLHRQIGSPQEVQLKQPKLSIPKTRCHHRLVSFSIRSLRIVFVILETTKHLPCGTGFFAIFVVVIRSSYARCGFLQKLTHISAHVLHYTHAYLVLCCELVKCCSLDKRFQ